MQETKWAIGEWEVQLKISERSRDKSMWDINQIIIPFEDQKEFEYDTFVFLLIPIQDSFSELEISTNTKVYSPEHTLQVYGTGLPGEKSYFKIICT